jgi:hypothetical protein
MSARAIESCQTSKRAYMWSMLGPLSDSRRPSGLQPMRDASGSAMVAQRIDEQGEGRRGLASAWVVEMVP